MDENISLLKLKPDVPAVVKTLAVWANQSLGDEITIYYNLEEHVFGIKKKASLFKRCIQAIINVEPLNDHHISICMIYLHGQMIKRGMDDAVKFVSPGEIARYGCGKLPEKSRKLAKLF